MQGYESRTQPCFGAGPTSARTRPDTTKCQHNVPRSVEKISLAYMAPVKLVVKYATDVGNESLEALSKLKLQCGQEKNCVPLFHCMY